MKQTSRRKYVAPAILDLGSIATMTQGGNGNGNDTGASMMTS